MNVLGFAHAADAGEFPAGVCPNCARTVLAYRDFDPRGASVQRCIHCDELLADVGPALLEDLEVFGYGFVDGEEKKGGCATTGACTLSGKKVSGPGEGGCSDGDCTHRKGAPGDPAEHAHDTGDDAHGCGGCD